MIHKTALLILLLTSLLLAQGCATPARTTTLEDNKLDPITLKFLKKRDVQLTVIDDRKVKQNEGNAPESETTVFKAVSEACLKGGLQVNTTSKAHLAVHLVDPDGKSQDGVCVKIKVALSVTGVQRYSEASSCQKTTNVSAIKLMGGVSDTYKEALNFAFQQLEK